MAEDRFAQLQEAKPISQSPFPKIQKVANHLRDRKEFAEYYSPRLLSLGPIHHGKPNLQLGEQYKLMWASMYVQGLNQSARNLHQKIAENIEDLKKLYTEDAIGDKIDDEKLAWMLFVDGCSLLQILKNPDILKPQGLRVKVDQMALVRQDVLLLENQLPFQLLKLLSHDTDAAFMETMNNFLQCHHFSQEKPPNETTPSEYLAIDIHQRPYPPPHLLDQLRWIVLRDFRPHPYHIVNSDGDSNRRTYRNIKELKAAGIGVKRSKPKSPIDISFSSSLLGGELRIPEIVVDDTTAPTYLNLIAYEVCPDFENNYEISSFAEFLDSLIDHAEDVKELREAGVLHNCLGSDEDVAKLFNVVSTDVVPDITIYGSVRADIERHYKMKHKTWIALAYHTYFSTPWTIIAFLAAFLALLLTFVQTWFAIFPSNHGK